MASVVGSNKIDIELANWSEEDRQDAIDFALHPGNGATAILVYLNHRGIKASLNTAYRWQKSLIKESDKIAKIRQIIGEFRGLEPIEILSFVAAAMTEALVNFQEKIAANGKIDLKDIQALTSLAKEARTSATSLISAQSTSSMKELELGFGLNFADKLESIFEGDEVTLERIKLACKGILTEIEGQYQRQN
jgi:hypothetical protein